MRGKKRDEEGARKGKGEDGWEGWKGIGGEGEE